jgi:hypothetical protein
MGSSVLFTRKGGKVLLQYTVTAGWAESIFGGYVVSASLGREVGNESLADMAGRSNVEFALDYLAAVNAKPNGVTS